MDCHGFTSNSIMFYPNLRKSSYSLEEYNKTKKIYHEEVKPQLTLILENVSISLNSMLPDLDFNVSEDLGSPFPNANVGKYAWGAITRKGKNKHTDLQFYVALRFDYLRFGVTKIFFNALKVDVNYRSKMKAHDRDLNWIVINTKYKF